MGFDLLSILWDFLLELQRISHNLQSFAVLTPEKIWWKVDGEEEIWAVVVEHLRQSPEGVLALLSRVWQMQSLGNTALVGLGDLWRRGDLGIVYFTLQMYWTAVESAADRVKPFREWNRKNNFMCCISLQFVVEILKVSWCGNDARLHNGVWDCSEHWGDKQSFWEWDDL